MEKKKILISSDCYLPRWDGVARFLSELIPHIKDQFDITLVVPKFEGKLRKIHGITLVRLPLMKIQFGDIYFSVFRKRQIRKLVEEADIVFNQTIGPIGMTAIKAAHKLKKPVVSYVHSIEWELGYRAVKHFKGFVKWGVKRLARKLYNKCTLLMIPSKETEDILSTNKIKTRKVVITLGVDAGKFIPPLSKYGAKKTIKIMPHKIVIGFCGRIGREKDLPTLIKAFKKIRQHQKNVVLLIVGTGIEEEVGKDIHLIVTGAVENVVPYLQAMDIFVLPSLTETSSLATMEAMSVGLPVVVTPVGSIREYVEDGENGLIFPRGDVNSLYEKLEGLLTDEKLRAQLGREARRTIKTKYQWILTAKKIRLLLEKI